MKNKLVVLVSIAILIVVVIYIHIYIYNIFSKTNSKLEIINDCFDGRECIYANDSILVGNSVKQLENCYYDLKIYNLDKGVGIRVNKLWYKKFNEKLYEEEYVQALIEHISRILQSYNNKFFIKNNEILLNILNNNLIQRYEKAKNNVADMFEYIIEDIKFSFYTEDYELIIKMEVI